MTKTSIDSNGSPVFENTHRTGLGRTRYWVAILAATCLMLSHLSRAEAVLVNSAPGGTANASSEGFTSIDDNANDGNRNPAFGAGSVWHSVDGAANHHWEVDLGSDMALDHVLVFPRDAAPSWTDFKIQVFDSGATEVFNQSFLPSASLTSAWGTNALRGVTGQRVRIQSNGTPLNTSMAEFEVYTQTASFGPNLVPSATWTASPAAFGTAISDGADGDIDGDYIPTGSPVYHSNAAAAGQFWQADFGWEQDLSHVNIFSRTDSFTTGDVTLTVLDKTLSPVFTTTVDLDSPDLNALKYGFTEVLPAGTAGRYVKLETVDAAFLAFAELEVFAAAPDLTLDLADVVGGGNGTGTGSDQGINITNGNAALAQNAGNFNSPINTYTSSTNPFVDGVFIPDGNTGSPVDIQVTSTGIDISGYTDTNGLSWDHIWNGESVLVSGGPVVDSKIGFHGQKGITFDLAAFEAVNPNYQVTSFSGLAILGNNGVATTLQIFLDGVEIFSATPGLNNGVPFDLVIDRDARFLTLTAAGGWASWGYPQLGLTFIPEPSSIVLGVFGFLGLVGVIWSSRRKTRSTRCNDSARSN